MLAGHPPAGGLGGLIPAFGQVLGCDPGARPGSGTSGGARGRSARWTLHAGRCLPAVAPLLHHFQASLPPLWVSSQLF